MYFKLIVLMVILNPMHVTSWGGQPQPLFDFRAAYWEGVERMIFISESATGTAFEAYSISLNNNKPVYLSRFNTTENGLGFRSIHPALQIEENNNILYQNLPRIYDFENERFPIPQGPGGNIYFSIDPITLNFLRVIKDFDSDIYRIEQHNFNNETVINKFESSISSLSQAFSPDAINFETYVAQDKIICELSTIGGSFSNSREIISIEFSNVQAPVVQSIRGGTFPDFLLPIIPEGIENTIIRYRDGASSTEMIWEDYMTGSIIREFDVGKQWVSHNVNPTTGNYYYHCKERVVEEPPDSGIFYTEIPVIISQDNFTTKTEVAFRVAHPTELPTPQDYVNHLAQVEEPIVGCPFPERKRITKVLFKDPDRNNDGQIDVADLVMRINEINSSTSRTLSKY
jgi:hypothetical protein